MTKAAIRWALLSGGGACVLFLFLLPGLCLGADDVIGYQLTEQEALLKNASEAAMTKVQDATNAELLAILRSPAPASLEQAYTNIVQQTHGSSDLMLSAGSMRYIYEKLLEKGSGFEDLSLDEWGDGLVRIFALSAILERSPSTAFSILGDRSARNTSAVLDAAYAGVVLMSPHRNAEDAQGWKWRAGASDWMRMLKGQNAVLRSLALQYGYHFADTDTLAAACVKALETPWPAMHRIALSEVEKLGEAQKKTILEDYMQNGIKRIDQSHRARMQSRAEKSLSRAEE